MLTTRCRLTVGSNRVLRDDNVTACGTSRLAASNVELRMAGRRPRVRANVLYIRKHTKASYQLIFSHLKSFILGKKIYKF